MNYFTKVEKTLKRCLKEKVKITTATIVGFLITGVAAFSADAVDNDKLTWETANGVYTNKTLHDLGTSKFVVGKDGKLVIDTHGNVNMLVKELSTAKNLEEIRQALWQDKNGNGYKSETEQGNYVVTGALAGVGNYDGTTIVGLDAVANKNSAKWKNVIAALKRFENSPNSDKNNLTITGDTTTIIGGKNSPVVLGLIGGDFLFNGFTANGLTTDRTGNSTVNVESGNLFGGTVGSMATGLGNTSVKIKFIIWESTLLADNSTAKTTINGNTNLNISKTANVAGVTAGGLALGLGGTAVSTVNGNSTIKIDSEVSGDKKLDGITAGIFGGGVAASILGGNATASTTGKTDITINNGLSVGVTGSGIALATDASQFLKDGTLGGKIVDGKYVIDPDGVPPITISGLNDGGTSIVTSGDTNISLTGKTSAAVILGNGVAVSHQEYQGDTTHKVSNSSVTAKNTNISVNVEKNIDNKGETVGKILTELKKLKEIDIKNGKINADTLISSIQGLTEATKGKGIVVGVAGNGISISAKAESSVTADNTNIDLQNGYVVGVLGNGITTANENAKSTAQVNGKSTVTVKGAEVVGLSGNGIALYYGIGNNHTGVSKVSVKDSEINVESGSADGVFGGGIAIDNSQSDKTNAIAETTGTSTINVKDGYVKDFEYGVLGSLFPNGSTGGQNYASYYKEIKDLGDGVAIFGGGVAAGQKAEATVKDSVINISGGKVEGDIVAGGLATTGATSNVDNSTINITGGEIIGSLYGQGKATNSGDNKGSATVKNSILNIDGYTNSIKNISGFTTITVGQNSNFKVEGIEVGDGTLTNSGTIILNKEDAKATLLTINGGSVENKGTLAVKKDQLVAKNTAGEFESTGTIKILEATADDLKNINLSDLFVGDYTFKGMLTDKDGNAVITADKELIGGELDSDKIKDEASKNNGEVNISGGTLTGGETSISSDSLNIYGDLTIKNADGNGVTIDGTTVNIDSSKKIVVGSTGDDGKADLVVKSASINNGTIELNGESTLTLDGSRVSATITGGKEEAAGTISATNSIVDGEIKVKELTIGGSPTPESILDEVDGKVKLALLEKEESTVVPVEKTTIFNKAVDVKEKITTKDENVEFNSTVTTGGGIEATASNNKSLTVKFGGDVTAPSITLAGNSTAYYASNIKLVGNGEEKGALTINGGTNVFEIANNGDNALLNSSSKEENKANTSGVTIGSSNGDNNTNVKLDISKVTSNITIDLGKDTQLNGIKVDLAGSGNEFYTLTDKDNNSYTLTFKKDLASTNGYSAELNDIFAATQYIGDILTAKGYDTVDKRAVLADTIYASNVYGETLRTAYENMKLMEDSVEVLTGEKRVGEWTANGKGIYAKTQYNRRGTLKNYSSDVETAGLMATFEYGLDDTTSTGVVFGGVKQNLNSEFGTADGDALYLGVFADKNLGANRLTAGVGYQFDKFDTDNSVLGKGDDYHSTALNVYVQGKHIVDLGEGLSFEPKVKLGYTYLNQDAIDDGSMRVESQDMNVVDAEVGFDFVKAIQANNYKVDLTFGTSYVRTMGDVDDDSTGSFYNNKGETSSFNFMGANLSENTVKFDASIGVRKDSGVFYNGGVYLQVGNDNTRNYGATLGAGYRF